MTDEINPSANYVSASIHRDFYYSAALDTATLVKEYPEIEQILLQSGFLACITIQIDQFREVEYQYGSQIYSQLQRNTREIIHQAKSTSLRANDILLVDLFDYDAFIIFLSPPRKDDTFMLAHLEEITERMRSNVEPKIFDQFFPYLRKLIKPSVGFSMIIRNCMINPVRLIAQLLRDSKEMGRFLAKKHEYSRKYLLQRLIIQNDISTVFQPVVDMSTLSIFGYEALTRGPAETEFASPMLLFVAASEMGLLFELDSLCRKKAFERARNLDPNTKILVNTLAMTIHDPEFRGKYLEDLLNDLQIKPQNVIFEVNEKLAIDNYDLFREAMRDYSDIGIVQAHDDIGHGYGDLERIMELNPGYMKLDMALIRGIDQSHIKREIVRAMVGLARGIGSQSIAEGIETPGEFQTLRDLGVSYGQGFLFGRPSPTIEPLNPSIVAALQGRSAHSIVSATDTEPV